MTKISPVKGEGTERRLVEKAKLVGYVWMPPRHFPSLPIDHENWANYWWSLQTNLGTQSSCHLCLISQEVLESEQGPWVLSCPLHCADMEQQQRPRIAGQEELRQRSEATPWTSCHQRGSRKPWEFHLLQKGMKMTKKTQEGQNEPPRIEKIWNTRIEDQELPMMGPTRIFAHKEVPEGIDADSGRLSLAPPRRP